MLCYVFQKLGLMNQLRGQFNFWGYYEPDDDWEHGGALFDVTKSDIVENNPYQAWER